MARIEWDATNEHIYETGVDHGVLYQQDNSGAYPEGVAWNGLTTVTETPSGAEANPMYADNIKYLNLYSAEELGVTVEAYTYPDEFAECDGSAELVTGVMIGQQARKRFGMAYRTKVGNEVQGDALGYKLHLLYGASAAPSERGYQTVNDSPEAITFSWELSTVPVNVAGAQPTALVTVDSTKVTNKAGLKKLEAVLYGAEEFSATMTYAVGDFVKHETKFYACTTAITTPGTWDQTKWTEDTNFTDGPRLPLPDEVKTLLTPASVG